MSLNRFLAYFLFSFRNESNQDLAKQQLYLNITSNAQNRFRKIFMGVCTASTKIRTPQPPHPLCRNAKDSQIRTKESLVYNRQTAKLIQKESMYWSPQMMAGGSLWKGRRENICGVRRRGVRGSNSRRWKGRAGEKLGKAIQQLSA